VPEFIDASITMDDWTVDSLLSAPVSAAADTWPLSAREAADLLGVNERTIRRAISRGELGAERHAGVYRIAPGELERFCARRSHSTVDGRTDGDTGAERARLPRPLTPLIGREHEIQLVGTLLAGSDCRLLTLIGPGGVGKTRIALQAAATIAAQIAGRAVFVPLAAVRDPALVGPAIARALEVRERGDRPLLDELMSHLQHSQTLLLIDNFEQVLAAADLVANLLSVAPELRVLVTSRSPLHIYGERTLVVPPLSLEPSPASDDSIPVSEAVRLFAQRAGAAASSFQVTVENAPTVAEICQRLDGLPLAIELAAARTPALSPEALLTKLEHRLPFLTNGPVDHPAPLRTMRDAIRWSYDLLDERDQFFFRNLGVFTGGFTLEAACQVAAAGDEDMAVQRIGTLIDHSLVRQGAGFARSNRYDMLHVLREFAIEESARRGEETNARARHASYYVARMARVDDVLMGPHAPELLPQLDDEMPNIRGALDWLDESGRHQEFVQVCQSLRFYWWYRNSVQEVRDRTSRALVLSNGWCNQDRCSILLLASMVADNRSERERKLQLMDDALDCARQYGDAIDQAWVLQVQGIVAWEYDEFGRAEELFRQSLRIQQDYPETFRLGSTLNQLGFVALFRRAIGVAAERLEEALLANRRSQNPNELGISLSTLGFVRHLQGRHQVAAGLLAESLAINLALGFQAQLTWCLSFVARVATALQSPEHAARLFGAEAALREVAGVPVPERELSDYRQALDRTTAMLGRDRFEAAWNAGSLLPWQDAVNEAIVLALGFAAIPDDERSGRARASELLTPREMEVLRLTTAGNSNREIADALYISVPTVKRHLTTIFAKLDVSSRAAAANVARTHGLA
jgi:excisionase family DNA binding protein